MKLFYITTITIAIITLIIMLTIVGIIMNKKQISYNYPKNPSSCPDYWQSENIIDADGNTKYYCIIPSSFSSTDVLNLKKNYNNNKIYIKDYVDYTIDISTGVQYINFNDNKWNSNTGMCKKYNWATKNRWSYLNNTPITWDGITNIDNNPCNNA